jgi:hypothetical protein
MRKMLFITLLSLNELLPFLDFYPEWNIIQSNYKQ